MVPPEALRAMCKLHTSRGGEAGGGTAAAETPHTQASPTESTTAESSGAWTGAADGDKRGGKRGRGTARWVDSRGKPWTGTSGQIGEKTIL